MSNIRNLHDFLAAVPVTLGYQPENKLVILGIVGTSLGPVMALDLPGSHPSVPAPEDYYPWIAAKLGQTGIDSAIAVVYYSHPTSEAEPLPHRALMTDLDNALTLVNIRVRAQVIVTESRWAEYSELPIWHSRDRITDSHITAQAVFDGKNVTASGPHIPSGELGNAAVSLRASSFASSLPRINTTADVDEHARIVAEASMLWCRLLDRPEPDGDILMPREVTWLTGYLQHRGIRDRFMVDIIAPDIPVEKYNDVFAGNAEFALSTSRVDRALSMLSFLLNYAGPEHRAEILTACGWVNYIRGNCSVANVYLYEAVKFDVGHRLAALLLTCIERNIIPKTAMLKPVP